MVSVFVLQLRALFPVGSPIREFTHEHLRLPKASAVSHAHPAAPLVGSEEAPEAQGPD
jgi:hypothetical protein